MHMSLWFGCDVGEFLFPGLQVDARWSFAVVWLALFIVSVLFEGSKVYLATVQREAQKKLYPYRTDERRNLLCERHQVADTMEPTTSRNSRPDTTLGTRLLFHLYQTLLFLVHNVAGYLLMLAVMYYNGYLIMAVVLGMMLGYFIFGPQLIMLQMRCFRRRRVVVCTPECDDTAEGTTPPLMHTSMVSDAGDFFVCTTRSCAPAAYFPTNAETPSGSELITSCHYGAKTCPSKVARANRLQNASSSRCEKTEEDSPNKEVVQLLRTEEYFNEPSDSTCCKSSHADSSAVSHEPQPKGCCKKKKAETIEYVEPVVDVREDSPQISCCHNAKPVITDSQERILE